MNRLNYSLTSFLVPSPPQLTTTEITRESSELLSEVKEEDSTEPPSTGLPPANHKSQSETEKLHEPIKQKEGEDEEKLTQQDVELEQEPDEPIEPVRSPLPEPTSVLKPRLDEKRFRDNFHLWRRVELQPML